MTEQLFHLLKNMKSSFFALLNYKVKFKIWLNFKKAAGTREMSCLWSCCSFSPTLL